MHRIEPRGLRRLALAGAAAALAAGAAWGQEGEGALELDLFRPQLEIGGTSIAERSLDDQAGEYSSQGGWFNLTVPLGATHLRPDKRVMGYQFLARVQLESANPDFTFLQQDRRLYSGGASVASLMLGRDGNVYLAAVGASAAEDDETLSDVDPRFFGLGLATRRLSKSGVVLAYGGSYTYVFGRGLLLPAFGVFWKINPKWSLSGVAPFLVAARYRAGESVDLRLRTGIAGNGYRFSNQGEFPGSPDTLYLQMVQWRTTAEVEWRAARSVSLLLQVGTNRTFRLDFAEDPDGDVVVLSDAVEPAPFVRASARFRFGKTLLDEWSGE
jgi:hypothetical protein